MTEIDRYDSDADKYIHLVYINGVEKLKVERSCSPPSSFSEGRNVLVISMAI